MKVSGAGIHTVSGKWGGAVLLAQRGMLGESRVILPLCWCWRRDHMSAEAAIASSRVRPAPDHTPPSGCPWLRRQTSSGLSPGTWLPKCIASADHRVQRWGEGSPGQVYSQDLQPFLSFCRTWVTWPTLGALIFLLVWPWFLVYSLILIASQPIMTRAHPTSKPVPSDFSKPAS